MPKFADKICVKCISSFPPNSGSQTTCTSCKNIVTVCGCGCGQECKNKKFVNAGHAQRRCVPWNVGLTNKTDERLAIMSSKLQGRESWNKGLTKDIDPRMRKAADNMVNNGGWNRGQTIETDERLKPQQEMMQNNTFALGYKHTEEEIEKIRESSIKNGGKSSKRIKKLHEEGKIGWKTLNSHEESYPESVFRGFLESLGAIKGKDFEQEYRVGSYLLDFAYVEEKRYVEIDGSQHLQLDRMKHDKVRDEWLLEQGWVGMRLPAKGLAEYLYQD